jgi:uncharacterized repeat protein (TIGR01451 family)
LSADGTVVVFRSQSDNLDPLDTDHAPDIYVKHLTTGDLTLASITNAGTKIGIDLTFSPALSGDGSRVAFNTFDNLDPADRNNNDVYMKDLVTGDVLMISVNEAGTRGGNASSVSPSINWDGTMVAFLTLAGNFDARDSIRGDADVYVKDLTPISPRADLSLTKVDRRDPVRSGRPISYTLSVQNLGPVTATGVTVTDQLPQGVSFVSATSQAATCTQSLGVVTCVFGSPLAPGGRASSIAVFVTAPTTGTVLNSASVVGNEQDPNPSNNQDTESTTVN